MPRGGPQPGSGAPSKLTADVARTICTAVANGDSFADACAMAGIDPDTRRDWLRRGADERKRRVKVVPVLGEFTVQGPDGEETHKGTVGWTSGKHRAFLDAFERAEAAFRSSCVGQIRLAGVDQWQAAGWLLERRYPAEFAKTDRVEHTGRDGGPVVVSMTLADLVLDSASDPESTDEPG